MKSELPDINILRSCKPRHEIIELFLSGENETLLFCKAKRLEKSIAGSNILEK